MDNQMGCAACNKDYTAQNPPRIIPNCGHSICENCISQSFQNKSKQGGVLVCPQDKQTTDIKQMKITNFPKNLALVKMIAIKKQNQSLSNNSINQPNTNININSNKNVVIEQGNGQKQEKGYSNSRSSKTQTSNKSIDQNLQDCCLIHQKPLEIICIKDRTKICSNCAIFGDHKGHDFKSIEEVQKDKMFACDEILRIIQKKETLILQLNINQTKQQYLKQLESTKQVLSKKINDSYSRLHDILNLSEKKSLQKLSKTFETLQPQLTNLKLPDEVKNEYEKWEEKAYEYIRSFQSNDLENQLYLLNYNNQLQTNVVESGVKVLKQLEQSYENVVGRAEQSIKEAIKVEFKNEIDMKLMNYCVIDSNQQPNQQTPKSIERKTTPSASRAKIQQQVKYKKSQPSSPSKQTFQKVQQQKQEQLQTQKQTEKQQMKQPEANQQRKVSTDDLLIEEHRYEDNFNERLFETNINIPFSSNFAHQIHELDFSGADTPTNAYSHNNIDLSPIEKNNKNNESNISNSLIRNIEEKKIPFKGGNILSPPTTKRKLKLKLPEKYQKVYDSILSDTAQVADFTNAELGDQVIATILQSTRGKKVKTLKLIRNKITDEGFDKVWEYLGNIITLNLSQNLLTDRFIDQLSHNLERLPLLKNVILSQNKIKERNVKMRIEEIKKHGIIVSI